MEWFNIIEAKYIPPTNYKPSRVGLFSPRFQERKIIPYDHDQTRIYDMAADYLKSIGHEIVGGGEGKDVFFLISKTFESIKPKKA